MKTWKTERGDSPILKQEVDKAVRMMKDGKSPGVDSISSEILKHGGAGIIDAFTVVCQTFWTTGQWPKDWTKSLITPLPKKGNKRLCQNHRTISLICHPSKVMQRVILNRLVDQAEPWTSIEVTYNLLGQNRSWKRNRPASDHRGEPRNRYSI